MVASSAPSARQIRRRLQPVVARAAATPGVDRYRKTFPALAHLWVLLLHVLWGSLSLSRTYASLTASPRWWQQWGMRTWISFSQLARSSTSRPSSGAEQLLAEVVAMVRRQPVANPLWFKLRRVVVLDSTFLQLSASLSPWSVHGQHAAGIRLHTMLELGSQIPTVLRMSLADVHDAAVLAALDLTAWHGWTLVLDRGYYGHQQFARLRAAGVRFIVRFHEQAAYQITAQHPVPLGPTPDGDTILADWTIVLGSANNRAGAVLPALRLVTSCHARGSVHRLVTDRTDLTATEIVQLYRKRWQIELFFRWLKRQLGAIRPLGRSREAVWLTILMVLIVALIALLLDTVRPPGVSRVAWLDHVAFILAMDTVDDS